MFPYNTPQQNNTSPFGSLKDAFSSLFNQKPQSPSTGGTIPLASTIPNYPFAPYQIKPGDTFEGIANGSGLNVDQITSANNNMLVPPPNGSFINLPVPQQYGPPALPDTYGPPAPLGTVYNRSKDEIALLSGAPLSLEGREKNIPTNASLEQINSVVAGGGFPDRVPANSPIIDPTTGAPVTPQAMIANGYIFNPSSREWVLARPGGTNVATGQQTNSLTQGSFANTLTGNLEAIQRGKGEGFQRIKASEDFGGFLAQESAFLNAKRWDPKRKKYVKIGDLIRQGRLDVKDPRARLREPRAQAQPQQPRPEPVPGAGTGPSTQLNVNQGGG